MNYKISVVDAFHNGTRWQAASGQDWPIPRELRGGFDSAGGALAAGVEFARKELRKMTYADGYDDDSVVIVLVFDSQGAVMAREVVTMKGAKEED